MNIQETKKYKYLGDIITPDGKNKENILDRKNKVQTATMIINSIAASEVLYGIETAVLLDLHEKKNVSMLLTNAESWKLNKGEEEEIEKVELQALKSMFDLPLHLPTPAIIFSFGILLTKQRIDKKMLIYLHKILNKIPGIWLKETFLTLANSDTGWFHKIQENLNKYELPEDLDEIRKKTIGEWNCQVTATIERENKERLLQMCHKNEDGIQVPKTKTETIVKKLENNQYKRGPESEFLQMTKNETKTIMIARYGMLDCGKNYKGRASEMCLTCNKKDDENHRLNDCIKWRTNNLYDADITVNFNNVYSNDINVLKVIIPYIQKVWNVRNANGHIGRICE